MPVPNHSKLRLPLQGWMWIIFWFPSAFNTITKQDYNLDGFHWSRRCKSVSHGDVKRTDILWKHGNHQEKTRQKQNKNNWANCPQEKTKRPNEFKHHKWKQNGHRTLNLLSSMQATKILKQWHNWTNNWTNIRDATLMFALFAGPSKNAKGNLWMKTHCPALAIRTQSTTVRGAKSTIKPMVGKNHPDPQINQKPRCLRQYPNSTNSKIQPEIYLSPIWSGGQSRSFNLVLRTGSSVKPT